MKRFEEFERQNFFDCYEEMSEAEKLDIQIWHNLTSAQGALNALTPISEEDAKLIGLIYNDLEQVINLLSRPVPID
jgi:hypothetical protein